ncbi:hypothetical protein DV711_12555 [Motiliproteus coralliicola]|uniref:Cytochrome c-552/4 domain-containing protein n=1 Tax=Motiliproteus coralliicola TaxID=2283196 RepID=A0A369WG97_9GAMM|nr:multiheme c-type cytochrome [Motiliproteus coralliicola]RDE19704.1 hypothetical protein DV711_12555 [Motiliproteus coralliicola]
MPLLRRLIYVPLLMLALPLSTQAGAEPPALLQLLYSGNLDGELEPCGCTLDTDFGGIQRQTTMIDNLREKNPELLLLNSGGLFGPDMGHDQIKHRFILSGITEQQFDAFGVQWADLQHGEQMLKESGLPFVAGNWKDDQLAKGQTLMRGDTRIFFSHWLEPENSPFVGMQAQSPITEDPKPVQQALDQAKQRGLLTVLSTSLPLEKAQQLFQLDSVDILLIKSAYEQFAEPQQLGNTLVLQPGSRGQRFALLNLELGAEKRILNWSQQVFDLPVDIANAERLNQWYEDYNETLRQDYLERVKKRKALKSGDSPYGGQQLCQACHQPQHEIWSQSQHAQAFTDLEEVGKAFDGHCVGCHVVGYEQEGGFLDQELTPNLSGVQCENCHGPAKEHALSAGKTATPNKGLPKEQICSGCHVKEHSPSFKPELYWPKIAHPGLPPLPPTQ